MLGLRKLSYFKKMIMGVSVGLLIVGVTPVFATVQEYILTKISYPIVINEVEYVDEELPALNYNGSTYLLLRNVGDILGSKVQWNAELKRVEIDKIKQPTISKSLINPKDIILSEEIPNEIPKYAYYNDKTYYEAKYALLKISQNGYQYRMGTEKNTNQIFYLINTNDNNKITYIFQEDDLLHIDGRVYFNEDVIESLIN